MDRSGRRIRRPALALLAALVLAACGRPAESPGPIANAAPAALPGESAHERGRRIYNFRCYYCHGYSGDARTLAATFLTPPPRDFTRTAETAMPRLTMIAAISQGRPGTGMAAFAGVIPAGDIELVADFVRNEFMVARAPNTRYHTPENGWPDHERFSAAFPFARGEVALDAPQEGMSELLRAGHRLFMATCVSCHDHARTESPGAVWEARPLSYPRNGFEPASLAPGAPPLAVDTLSGASPYALHDRPRVLAGLSAQERRGEALFQANCAFCHAADGTGRNWIGSFLEPHPRDLTSPEAMHGMTRKRLAATIAKGLPNTSMPAWEAVLTREDIRAVVAYVGRAFQPLPE